MNKKYYVAPATEAVGLHTESTLLTGSKVDGLTDTLTEEEGLEELSRKKYGFGSYPWFDMGDE